mgnify:CR=1 FL=1
MSNKVVFFGRSNCSTSKKILNFLKIKFKKVIYVESKKIGKRLNENSKIFNTKIDYIFCFRSFYKLNKLLKKVRYTAINFHPSSPKYRGAGGVNFAMYSDKYFGCTAHIMSKKIDKGAIIDCKFFKINKYSSLEKLLNKTYILQFNQLKEVINGIILKKNYLKIKIKMNKNKWGKKFHTMKDLEKFYEISKNISKKKLNKKIKSTLIKDFKPYVIIHGKKFVLEVKKK